MFPRFRRSVPVGALARGVLPSSPMLRALAVVSSLVLGTASLGACAVEGAASDGDTDSSGAAASKTQTSRELMPSVARLRLVRTMTDPKGKRIGLEDDVTVADAAEVERVSRAIRTFKSQPVSCKLTEIPTTIVTFFDVAGRELGTAILGCSMSVLALENQEAQQVAYTAETLDDAVLRGQPTSPALAATRTSAIEHWRLLGGFANLDTNRDGRVVASESAAAAKRKGLDPELVAKVIRVGLDRDGDGAVSAVEASIAE